jgi:CPA2 family monovalent cation:H+ antiporter-2
MFSGPHVIIAGFGLPGRAVAQTLDASHVPYCVLELNAATVSRCAKAGTHIVEGDAANPDVLRKAHIETAAAIVIAIPDEKAALEATRVARQLNPDVKIITRTHFVSAGMEAKSRGADAVVIAEQVVATELSKLAEQMLAPTASP